MEALLADKQPTKRTSLTSHMYEASVALHAAINGMKPRLMKKKMLLEIKKGVEEIHVLKQTKLALENENRIICEEMVAIQDRKYFQTVEVNKERKRLARCLDNLNHKKHAVKEAAAALAKADDPADSLHHAMEATDRMTEKRLQEFTKCIEDETTEEINQSTKYAFDALSLLLSDSMPPPKEKPVTLQLSYEELYRPGGEEGEEEGEEGEEEEEETSTHEEQHEGNGSIDSNDDNNPQPHGEASKKDSTNKSAQPLDAVAKATALHRKSIGLSAVTKRSSQQSAFLKALAPKKSTADDSATEPEQAEGEQEHLEPEQAVKAFSRTTRQSVIEHVGKDEWITLSWEERLAHMHEFGQPEEEKEEAFEIGEDYDDVFEQEMRYFQSTIDSGTALCPKDGTFVDRQRKQRKHEIRYIRCGILATDNYPLLVDRLQTFVQQEKEHENVLVGLINAEKEELMEGYMDIGNMCRFTLWLGKSGALGEAVWDWVYAVLDYAVAKPIYDELTEELARTVRAEAQAQEIYDVAEKREADSALKLKKLTAVLPQTAWYRRRQEKYIHDHDDVMTARTKWPIYLRPLAAPAKFTVMVQQVASMRGKLARLIRALQITTAAVHQQAAAFQQASEDLRVVQEECASVLCPWNWYTPDGIKWASRIHNKWFVVGCRVTVFEEDTGLEVPGTIREVYIHPNGRKRTCTVQFDGGGSDEDIPHIRIKMQYPQKVSMERAMEDSHDKFVSTQFDTACQTKMLLNIKIVVPRLETCLNHVALLYEDARTCLYRSDGLQREAGAQVLQCIWRRQKRSVSMKKVRTWKSGAKMRAFLSANLIKFRKMKARNQVFSTRLLQRVHAIIQMQRVVRGHSARVVYWEILDAIAEAERVRIERLEQRRQEQEFANRLRAAQVAAARTKNWRCPRCPLSVAYKTRFTSPQAIEAHIALHDAENVKQLEAMEEKEAFELEQKRLQRLARASKEEVAMIKMRKLMEERQRKLAIEAVAQAKKKRVQKLEQMNALFTIKYQRPVLPSLRRKGKGGGLKSYTVEGFAPVPLSPPYPELRLVRNSMRSTKIPHRGGNTSVLPEKIFITCSPFRFGRSSNCDAPLDCLDHPGLVSKDHALLFVRGSPLVGYTLVLADLHSTNGTFVDQKRIKASTGTEYDRHNKTVEDGAIVVFGCTKALPTPENTAGGSIELSTVCYQLWKMGSGFHSFG